MLVTEKKHIYENLQSLFGAACQTDASLARYTAARVGGQADALLVVNSVEALTDYLAYMRDPAHFRESVNMIVDDQGLEVSLR